MSMSARTSMFQSVFPSTSDSSRALTPQATPLLAQESFDQFRTQEPTSSSFHDAASESVRWERAWHTAVSFLTGELQSSDATRGSRGQQKDAHAAIEYLVSPDSVGWRLRKESKEDDLLWWYSQTLQEQFLHRHSPILTKYCQHLTEHPQSWHELRTRLKMSRSVLISPFEDFLLPHVGTVRRSSLELLEMSYKALVSQLLLDRIRQPLLKFLMFHISQTLDTGDPSATSAAISMEGVESSFQEEVQSSLQQTLADLVNGGFPAESLERILAKALDEAIHQHVIDTCSRRWESPSPIAGELQAWVGGPLARLAGLSLGAIRGTLDESNGASNEITSTNVKVWQQSALQSLGLLRLSELFDIIVDWDLGSKGGIEDLKQFVSNQQTRTLVSTHFNNVLTYRLLHPGASTDQILEVYIKIMRAFAVLDPRFVILDRVSRPVRRYLRDRDDTIRIIVAGLLSDPSNPETTPDALGELSVELHEMDEIVDLEDDDDANWDDMNWVPNPADAETDYKGSKSGLDVIGNLLSLFEAKDTVVKEFQNMLGERLLSPESDFSREIRVLELLKSRFGEAPLQGCEVMIKDIFDSNRTDILIKKEQGIVHDIESKPKFYTKILSRFFWPSLRDDTFRIPSQIQSLQDRYSTGFEEHKMQRKLAWLPSLGQVRVELQLEDRTVDETVTPWQASVIYAFNESSTSGQSPELTREQVASQLEMDDDLVTNALTFWVSKLVLYEPSPGKYRVLESTPIEEGGDAAVATEQASADIVAAAHSASAAAAASAASAVRSEEELAEEKMEVLWQYAVGMLTNQGAMPLQQMVMMLNFVVPGGFTHSQEEFGRFLQRKVDEGLLQMSGASFKMPKK